MKKIRLNVMLLKNGVSIEVPESFIEGYSSASEIPIDKGELKAIFYKKLGAYKQPEWIKDLKNKIIGSDLSDSFPKSQTSGATLFISVQNRIFAINFGTLGRFNIKKDTIEKTFGIYTANKLLADDENIKIKGAHSRVNETNPVNKQRQYGANISNNQLFLSMEDNEALRELAIFNPESEDFYRLIGKYNSLNVQFVFKDMEVPCLQYLSPKLEKLLDIYKSVTKEDIKQLFKGIFPLPDAEANSLNAQLSGRLTSSPESFFLFEPDSDFDLSLVSKFRINTSNGFVDCDELSLPAYLQLMPSPQKQNLEDDSIYALNDDDSEIKVWSIFDCLYGEIEENGTNYILSHGDWYEVSKDKYDRISTAVDRIIDGTFIVPVVVKSDTKADIQALKTQNPNEKINKENIFNSKLCAHLNAQFFDEGIKQITVCEDKFEVCDLLVLSEKKFIHVKYNYGASALSHLFNQGFVSARSYAEFKDRYAQAVNAHIQNVSQHITNEPNDICVHYLVINDKSEDRLTFFSKMVLEDKIRTLEAMKVRVKLSWVRDVY